jgi:multiple sugar transport system substrate-binding protein
MYLFYRFKSIVFLLILLSFSSCSKNEEQIVKDPKYPYKGVVLNVWTFTDELIKPAKEFEEKYKCKINLTIIPGNDYLLKTTAPLASGVGAPDVFTIEGSFAKNFTDEDFFVNLSQPPYNADKLKNQYTPYVYKLGCDKEGNVVALSNQMTPGGLFYRRSIAKKAFGTDDPVEIAKHFSTMDKLFKSAKILKENGYKLFPGWRDLKEFTNPKQLPWVDGNNNLILPKSRIDYFDESKELMKSGYTANIVDWTPPWFACMYGPIKDSGSNKKIEVFGYVLPAWGLSYLLKTASPNTPPAGEKPKNPTSGDWAVTSGPCPFFSGGTWIGIYKGSKNKDLAWKFVQYIAYKSKYLEDFYASSGDTPSLVYLQKKFEKNCADKFLGGQNYMKFFIEQAKTINPNKVTKYDQDLDFFYKAAVSDYVNGLVSKKEAIKSFKENVKTAFYEINID